MWLKNFQKAIMTYFKQPLKPIVSMQANSFRTKIFLALSKLRLALMQLELNFSMAIPSCVVSGESS
jgi:hypothetical protein